MNISREGSKQVNVFRKEDKREMTVLLSCTMSGFLFPPHLIYCGKTNKGLTFPIGWDIHHSKIHWSTEVTMQHFIESVIVPYVQYTKERLTLTGRRAVELNPRIAVPRVRRNFVLTKNSCAFCFISFLRLLSGE